MNQHEEIIGLMKGSIPYTKKTLSGLSDLIDEYPYFQVAHLLHTLNLLHLKDTHFLFDLRKTAIYVPDRRQLFFRIEDNFFDPELMEELKEKILQPDSPSELIDSFLSKNGDKTGTEEINIELSPVSTDYLSYFLSDKTENVETPPLQHQETVDKFLEEEAISPLKINLSQQDEPEAEYSEPPSESTIGEGFFSETLAKIYIKQKKYGKALDIIRKLNLIYPEKSRYFADQIRFLERLIIYTNKN